MKNNSSTVWQWNQCELKLTSSEVRMHVAWLLFAYKDNKSGCIILSTFKFVPHAVREVDGVRAAVIQRAQHKSCLGFLVVETDRKG